MLRKLKIFFKATQQQIRVTTLRTTLQLKLKSLCTQTFYGTSRREVRNKKEKNNNKKIQKTQLTDKK